MSKPFFSIVIPTLNEEKYLPNLLSDLAAQTYQNFEVLVIDGDSEDGTVEAALQFKKKLSLKVFSCKTRNVGYQRNKGGEKATAGWIIFMDADNRLPTYYLRGLLYQIEKNPETDLFTTWIDRNSYQNEDEKIIATAYNAGILFYRLVRKPTAVGALLGVHKRVFDQVQFESKVELFEDTDFVSRCIDHNFTLAIFREPHFTYSFRRFKKEGTLKMLSTFAQINLKTLLGQDVSQLVKHYPMNGGRYYEELAKSPLYDVRSLITKASRKQLEQIKTIIDTLRE